MANTKLFSKPSASRHIPVADSTNAAGGKAYALSAHQALAQFATTGTFNSTFYVDAKSQLSALNAILPQCDPTFIAKTAVYARERAFMKDMPVYLTAYLFVLAKTKDLGHLPALTFNRVVRNGKLVRNFVQFLRSGVLIKTDGKANVSLGSRAKKVLRVWFNTTSVKTLVNGTVGNSPSLRDVIRMVRPVPVNPTQSALFAWIAGKDTEGTTHQLPTLVQQLLNFRAGLNDTAPEVDFRLIVDGKVSDASWKKIAKNATWHMARMNLNTFERHNVLKDDKMVDHLANLLKNPEQIHKSMVFPYQLMAAYVNAETTIPKLRNALQDALDTSIDNVPKLDGKVVVCPDVSGSMNSPVTGYRSGSSSKVRCIDVAALVASAMLKRNDAALVLPFDTSVHSASALNPRDSVMTNALKLAKFGGGGTSCVLPLRKLNNEGITADLVFYVSDNESWCDRSCGRGTAMMEEWVKFKRRNPKAKLVLLDITPSSNSQLSEDKDILRIGGFSDEVFRILPDFLSGEYGKDAWVERINKVQLDSADAD